MKLGKEATRSGYASEFFVAGSKDWHERKTMGVGLTSSTQRSNLQPRLGFLFGEMEGDRGDL